MLDILLAVVVILAFVGVIYMIERLLGRLQGGTSDRKNATDAMTLPSSSEEAIPESLLAMFLRNRFVRFVITLVVVLAVLALALYGAVWAVTHPNDPIALVYVVGLIVLFGLAHVFHYFHWFKFLRDLFKVIGFKFKVYVSDMMLDSQHSVDSDLWREYLDRYETIQFLDPDSEVDFGAITKKPLGYDYIFEQGGAKKEVAYNQTYIDYFVVDYYFEIWAGSEYGESHGGLTPSLGPLTDNRILIPIRRQSYDVGEFIGHFSINTSNYDRDSFIKINNDLCALQSNVRIEVWSNDEYHDFVQFDLRDYKPTEHGAIWNIPYRIKYQGQIDQYLCIKHNRFLQLFSSGGEAMPRSIKKNYLSRRNIYIWE